MKLPRSLMGAFALTVGASLACSGLMPEPVPEDRMDYVGSWKGGSVELRIEANGMVDYVRSEGGNNTSLNAPIQAWHDRGFDVGFGPIVTTFVVDEPPKRVGSVWHMKVDGQALERR